MDAHGHLPPGLVWHGTDLRFNEFETDHALGAHFGTRDAAMDRLRTTGRDKIRLECSVASDDGVFVEEFLHENEAPIQHGPFADQDAAQTFIDTWPRKRQPTPYMLLVSNPLLVDDLGEWTFAGVFSEVSRMGIIASEPARDRIWSAWQATDRQGWSALKSNLLGEGFDCMVYRNSIEDVGSLSWIVFHASQAVAADQTQQAQRGIERPRMR